MQVRLAYGRDGLTVDFPDDGVEVIAPRFVAGLPDETAALRSALRDPLGARPLRELVAPGDDVLIVFPDVTRPMPSARVLPVLLAELDTLPPERITLLNALGAHRPNTRAELTDMLGAEIVGRYRILQHDPADRDALVNLGRTRFGREIWINRAFVEAQVRILTGFIEPHFFAGFSGGPKAVMPGICGLDTILGNHGAAMIDHPGATWGETEANPVYQEMAQVAERAAPEFLVNVTLNRRREITGVFAGDWRAAHRAGCAFVRQSAMRPVDGPYDCVVTTNAGFPLDANLYQAVKGLSAAARIVRPGGTLVLAAACTEGMRGHENFYRLLHASASPEALLAEIRGRREPQRDQWQAQILAGVLGRATVHLHSGLTEEAVRRCHLRPVEDVGAFVRAWRDRNPRGRIAVLPEGPQTIPCVQPDSGLIGRQRPDSGF